MNNLLLSASEANVLEASQASQSPGRVLGTSDPDNRSYLVAEDLRGVAQALGLPANGDNRLLVQSIRNAVGTGGMSPRSQQTTWG